MHWWFGSYTNNTIPLFNSSTSSQKLDIHTAELCTAIQTYIFQPDYDICISQRQMQNTYNGVSRYGRCKHSFKRLSLVVHALQLIAIGPTTEAAIKQSFGRVSGTAERPTAHHVCQVIRQLALTDWRTPYLSPCVTSLLRNKTASEADLFARCQFQSDVMFLG